jgi:hypothetical protein
MMGGGGLRGVDPNYGIPYSRTARSVSKRIV